MPALTGHTSHQQSGSAHSNSLVGAGFSFHYDAEKRLRQALAGEKVISQTAIRRLSFSVAPSRVLLCVMVWRIIGWVPDPEQIDAPERQRVGKAGRAPLRNRFLGNRPGRVPQIDLPLVGRSLPMRREPEAGRHGSTQAEESHCRVCSRSS